MKKTAEKRSKASESLASILSDLESEQRNAVIVRGAGEELLSSRASDATNESATDKCLCHLTQYIPEFARGRYIDSLIEEAHKVSSIALSLGTSSSRSPTYEVIKEFADVLRQVKVDANQLSPLVTELAPPSRSRRGDLP